MSDAPPSIRPTSVTVIAALHIVAVASILYVWTRILDIPLEVLGSNWKALHTLLLYSLPALMGISLILSIGLLYLQNWARITSIVLYLFSVALSLAPLALNNPQDFPSLLSPFAISGLAITFAIILASHEVAHVFK